VLFPEPVPPAIPIVSISFYIMGFMFTKIRKDCGKKKREV
jgi:hypothetical protein